MNREERRKLDELVGRHLRQKVTKVVRKKLVVAVDAEEADVTKVKTEAGPRGAVVTFEVVYVLK